MQRILGKTAELGRKARPILGAFGLGGVLLFGSGVSYVSAQNGALGEILGAATENPCTQDGAEEQWDAAEAAACATENESNDVADIDLGGDAYAADKGKLTEEDREVLGSLSDQEAEEVATLFDEEDSEPQEIADVDTPSQEDVAAAEAPPAVDEGEAVTLEEDSITLAAAPADAAAGESQAGSDEVEGFDSAQAGSDSAGYSGTIQGTGSLIALGVGEGLATATNDPTSLDSVADVVVGNDPAHGTKDNLVQVTALGGVTDGTLSVTVLEGLNGDTSDPAAQFIALNADNAPSGASAPPSLDGVAEINVGDDPDGQSFNVVQLDIGDDNFLSDGSESLANIAVADGVDEGFGSLLNVSIGGQNNGEHSNIADVALGSSLDPLADPLSPLTGGVNDLGVAIGGGIAPVLSPVAGALR